MRLHELKAVPGATRAPKRKGRGTATGQGKTAGRGMNGQNSRSGGIVKQVKDGIKILGNGKLEKNLTVQAQKFTKSALEKIEAAGGKAQVI